MYLAFPRRDTPAEWRSPHFIFFTVSSCTVYQSVDVAHIKVMREDEENDQERDHADAHE
jgi:hypothetical protein